jgi:coenzyme F420-reducing hydrogenase alpha subunit
MKLSLKTIYLKLAIITFVFITISVGYFLSFRFYKQKLIKKIEEINSFKAENLASQSQLELLNRQKQLVTIFEQKSGKNLDEILTILENNFNRKSSELIQKITEKKWQITENTIDELNNLKLGLFLKPEEINDFFDFFINQWLFLKTSNLKIIKKEQGYNINLTIKTEK